MSAETKWCSKCQQDKSFDAFNKNRSKKDGVQDYCRLCHQAYMTAHYAANPARRQAIRDYDERQSLVLKKHMLDWLENHPCVDCGEADIIVLEFDHVRGVKRYTISKLIRGAVALKTLQTEIDKCDVRCCNCHRRATCARALANGQTWKGIKAIEFLEPAALAQ